MDDLVNEFIIETNEALEELDQGLVSLEKNPNDEALLSKIFRIMHTVKGTCGFLELSRLESVAHASENLLCSFRDGELEVSEDAVTLIFESLDAVKSLVQSVEQNGKEPEGDDQKLIDEINSFLGDAVKNNTVEHNITENEDQNEAGAIDPEIAAIDKMIADMEAKEKAQEEAQEEAQKVAEKEKNPEPLNSGSGATPVVTQTLRVNVDVLESLMTMVSELVLIRNQLLQIHPSQGEDANAEYSEPMQRVSQVVSELQDGVMKTRMQPIGNAWTKLPRIIRDISKELNKNINLEMQGQDTELDRQVLEMIKDPLTHMVRNSADHGVETADIRESKGKPKEGTINLNAYHEGGHIVIEIKDDGKGIPVDVIKAKAIEKKLVSAEEADRLQEQQILQFIFAPGFSTAEKVTSVSGRGVGMDVVKTNIDKIGGTVEVSSKQDKGTTFLIKIPLTLAIVPALIVSAGQKRFALPQLAVRELLLVSNKGESKIEYIDDVPVFRLRGQLLPLIDMNEMLGHEAKKKSRRSYVIVTETGSMRFGLIVDQVFDTEEIVVKPVSGALKSLPIYSGNTILGDGSVIMILDPANIARENNIRELVDESQIVTEQSDIDKSERTIFLVFDTGEALQKAIPLTLISRLEHVKREDIEESGTGFIMKYRDTLMPLVKTTNAQTSSDKKEIPILVFESGKHRAGILIEAIEDIVEAQVNLDVSANREGIQGTTIINGKTTELIDTTHYLTSIYPDWFGNNEHFDLEKEKGGIDVEGGGNITAKKRLLLLDDSHFFLNMLQSVLKMAGYDVTAVDDPLNAQKICEANEAYDLIISDIEMPHMNGFEFARWIKESCDQHKETPLVALSSRKPPKGNSEANVFDEYVEKFDRDKLLNAINKVMGTNHE